MNKNKVKVTISGSTYFLITDQSQEHVQQAALYIDHTIQDVQQAVGDYSKAAVLVALQLASKILILEQQQQYATHEQERLMEKLDSLIE